MQCTVWNANVVETADDIFVWHTFFASGDTHLCSTFTLPEDITLCVVRSQQKNQAIPPEQRSVVLIRRKNYLSDWSRRDCVEHTHTYLLEPGRLFCVTFASSYSVRWSSRTVLRRLLRGSAQLTQKSKMTCSLLRHFLPYRTDRWRYVTSLRPAKGWYSSFRRELMS